MRGILTDLNEFRTPCSACVDRQSECKKRSRGRFGCEACLKAKTWCTNLPGDKDAVGEQVGEPAVEAEGGPFVTESAPQEGSIADMVEPPSEDTMETAFEGLGEPVRRRNPL